MIGQLNLSNVSLDILEMIIGEFPKKSIEEIKKIRELEYICEQKLKKFIQKYTSYKKTKEIYFNMSLVTGLKIYFDDNIPENPSFLVNYPNLEKIYIHSHAILALNKSRYTKMLDNLGYNVPQETIDFFLPVERGDKYIRSALKCNFFEDLSIQKNIRKIKICMCLKKDEILGLGIFIEDISSLREEDKIDNLTIVIVNKMKDQQKMIILLENILSKMKWLKKIKIIESVSRSTCTFTKKLNLDCLQLVTLPGFIFYNINNIMKMGNFDNFSEKVKPGKMIKFVFTKNHKIVEQILQEKIFC
jgi:hypothetical protein